MNLEDESLFELSFYFYQVYEKGFLLQILS